MKKLLFSLALSLVVIYPAAASHLTGQDFTYVFVDSTAGIYHYRVSLNIYQDCLNGEPESIVQDDPAFFALYNTAGLVQADSVHVSSAYSMPLVSSGSCASMSMFAFCRNRKTFTKDYYLTASASGYTIVYQRCCKNTAITNIIAPGNKGMTAYCTIPSSGTTTHNNSAVFTNYPPFIIALNTALTFDFSATDADGDSLSYELCQAYSGAADVSIKPFPPSPPPFDPESYTPSLSYSNPMSCSVPLAINDVTGTLTATPNITGQYLIAVCCKEWRGGMLVNTVVREFEFMVMDCTLDVQSLSAGGITDVYPNPANTQLTITAKNRITSVDIFNLLGQTVYTHNYNTETVKVAIDDLPKGIYFVRINNTEVRKFVKE